MDDNSDVFDPEQTTGGKPKTDEKGEPKHSTRKMARMSDVTTVHELVASTDSLEGSIGPRRRKRVRSLPLRDAEELDDSADFDFVIMNKPENELEARRMVTNYLFGFRKWKSHVTQRPLAERSELVQQLYKDDEARDEVNVCTVGNICYVVLCGWWVALIYLLLAFIMLMSIVGFKYCNFCFQLGRYFLWPFGKFVHKASLTTLTSAESKTRNHTTSLEERNLLSFPTTYQAMEDSGGSSASSQVKYSWRNQWNHRDTGYWKKPGTYIWLLIALPVLVLTHSIAFLLTWLFVITIPVAKIHGKTIQKVLLLPPELLWIQQSDEIQEQASGDIIMYIYHAVNIFYYKYTVDGMNVFFVNMMVFVILSICIGYVDENNQMFSQMMKFSLALISIIPLAYYIGMGISSISAQSSYAIGAVMNATFGSIVEIILYLSALYKGIQHNSSKCYENLVKSALVGTLLATTLLIPGIAMVVGGIKHRSQRFNPTSAGVTATLLFVSVAAVFAPSIFSRSYAMYKCDDCRMYNTSNHSEGMECSACSNEMLGTPSGLSLYRDHVMPLIYCCCVLLPIAYIIGLVYSLKTHKALVHDAFVADVAEVGHGTAQWSRVKSSLILLVSVILMSVCADLVTYNIEPLLGGDISVYFIGVTLLALVPDIPEIVIGIQFALQNNISLSIEVGSCIAVQVCMLQIPVIVFVDLIYKNGFYLLFTDIHIWSVIIGVLLNNYVFQDGKSNYFQGFALVLTYLALVAMYFFAPNPPGTHC